MAENFPSDSEYAYTLEIREESLFSLRECTNKTFLQCNNDLCSALLTNLLGDLYLSFLPHLSLEEGI